MKKYLLQKNFMIREKYPMIEKINKSSLIDSNVYLSKFS